MARRTAPDLTSIRDAFSTLAEEVKAFTDGKTTLISELQEFVRQANAMIADLGGRASAAGASPHGGRPRGYRASEETKAKLRAAWKRRRTKTHGPAEKVTRILSPEARERIAAAQRKRWADARKK